MHYLPILFIDQLSNRVKDLMVSELRDEPRTRPPGLRARRPPPRCPRALGRPCSGTAAGRAPGRPPVGPRLVGVVPSDPTFPAEARPRVSG